MINIGCIFKSEEVGLRDRYDERITCAVFRPTFYIQPPDIWYGKLENQRKQSQLTHCLLWISW